jgi:phospholipid/cholesterol/gamma-HCH transport system substrate-binding protein
VKRLALIAALCCAAVALLAAGPGASSGNAGDSAGVDALFRNAAGLVGGEDVKVAGVPAGIVDSVELTDSRLALVRMEVDSPFAPFHGNARCEVRSQSLIGERFIQCDPGTPAAGDLPAGSDGTPTVPVEQDSAPIDLDLLFDVFRGPYRDRLAIILNELGAGLDGRGADLNRIIREANPNLAATRRVVRILNGQRNDLTRGIDQTDRVLAAIAAKPQSVSRFVGKLAAVSERFGSHSGALEESTARLPGLLGQAEPALRQLDGLSVQGLPVLRNLRRSAPGVTRLSKEVGPLARATEPTLRRLGHTAVVGTGALRRSMPFLGALRRTLVALAPISPTTRRLVSSLIERGWADGLLRFFYNSALATSRFDATSHFFPAHLIGGICGLYRANEPPVEGCHGRFTNAPAALTLDRHAKRGRPPAPAAPLGAQPTAPALPQAKGGPRLPSLPSLPALPSLPSAPSSPSGGSVGGLLDFLLGR